MKETSQELWLRFCVLFTDLQYKKLKRQIDGLPRIRENISSVSSKMSHNMPNKGFLNDFAKKGPEEHKVVQKIKLMTITSF